MTASLLLQREQELQEQIAKLQQELDKTRSFTPLLLSTEEALDKAYEQIKETEAQQYLVELLSSKLKTWGFIPVSAVIETSPTTASTNTTKSPSNPTIDIKPIRERARAYLDFAGSRLTAQTCRDLLVTKLEEFNLKDLIPTLSTLEPPTEFWQAADKVLDALEQAEIKAIEDEAYDIPSSSSNELAPVVPVIAEVPPVVLDNTAITEVAEIKPVGLSREQVTKGAVVQNIITKEFGAINYSGIVPNKFNLDCASVQYSIGIKLSPLTELIEMVGANSGEALTLDNSFSNTTTVVLPVVEEVSQEVEQVVNEPVEYTPEEILMLSELQAAGNSLSDINDYLKDEDIEAYTIGEIYQYLLGKPPLTSDSDVDF